MEQSAPHCPAAACWAHRATAKDWAEAGACLLELRARVEALEAMQQPEAEAEVADPQSLHSIALLMVDSLGREFGILPEVIDTLRRAIREPMQGEAAAEEFSVAQPRPALTLVETVAGALSDEYGEPLDVTRLDAATTVLAVADWMENQHPDAILNAGGWAALLRQEVQRCG